MKKQIRLNVFETNSSSTHAICISKSPVELSNLSGAFVYFENGEFGWEVSEYSDLDSKASYLYQAVCDIYQDEKERSKILNQITDILAKFGISCRFKAPHKDRWGFEEGYIDHGGETSEFVHAVLHSEKRLLRYLFGDSVIFTGNDNDDFALPLDRTPESDYEIYYKGN